MTKTTVYLESDVALDLRRIAAVEGRSQAELIRDAIAAYTRGKKKPRIPGVGEFDSGHTDTSTRAEEILAEAARSGARSGTGRKKKLRGAGR
jgi:hypothetical protein